MSWILSRCTVVTGCVRPGADTAAQFPRYPQNSSASSVADITTSFSGRMFKARRRRGTSRRSASRKSPSRLRSWISSSTTCDTSRSKGSPCILRSRMPAVMNVRRVSFVTFASSRTWCPTRLPAPPTPRASHRSAQTRSATVSAATRRGCVHTTRQLEPSPRSMASSSRYCGTCVVFPEPVSPHTTAASESPSRNARSKASRSANTGRFRRNDHMARHFSSSRRAAASPSKRASTASLLARSFSPFASSPFAASRAPCPVFVAFVPTSARLGPSVASQERRSQESASSRASSRIVAARRFFLPALASSPRLRRSAISAAANASLASGPLCLAPPAPPSPAHAATSALCASSAHRRHAARNVASSSSGANATPAPFASSPEETFLPLGSAGKPLPLLAPAEAADASTSNSARHAAAFCASLTEGQPSGGTSCSGQRAVTVEKAAARAAAPPPTRFLAPSRGLRSTTAAYAAPRDTAPTDAFAPGLEPGVTSTTFSYRGAIQPSWRHSIWSSALGGCAGTLGCRAAAPFLPSLLVVRDGGNNGATTSRKVSSASGSRAAPISASVSSSSSNRFTPNDMSSSESVAASASGAEAAETALPDGGDGGGFADVSGSSLASASASPVSIPRSFVSTSPPCAKTSPFSCSSSSVKRGGSRSSCVKP